jgi:acyl carrier protein
MSTDPVAQNDSSRPTEQILADLATMLADFQGRQYSDPIGAGTLFFDDLGFASIDAVVLGESLESKYGQDIPFGKFLASLRDEEVQDIEVGRLAEFLSEHLQRT